MSVRCPRCSAEYPNGANFCTKDGTRLVPVPESAPVPPPPGTRPAHRLRPTTPREGSPPAGGGAGTVDFSRLVGQTLDDRYRIVKKLGEGGMSHVFLAMDVTSGERVAIKILSPALSKGGSGARPR
jgi:hypothetical protein